MTFSQPRRFFGDWEAATGGPNPRSPGTSFFEQPRPSIGTIRCYTVAMIANETPPARSQRRAVKVIHAGSMEYLAAWEQQRELARQRSAGTIDDTLMLVEHPHTYTLGRATKDGH